jgi:ABC-type transporter Mla subunit MlaD
VQQATQQTVSAIQEIARTITEMSQISTSIAAAMEEQGAATAEIARNVQEAARGTEHVTGNIADVRQGAGATGAAASQVLGAAQELAQNLPTGRQSRVRVGSGYSGQDEFAPRLLTLCLVRQFREKGRCYQRPFLLPHTAGIKRIYAVRRNRKPRPPAWLPMNVS